MQWFEEKMKPACLPSGIVGQYAGADSLFAQHCSLKQRVIRPKHTILVQIMSCYTGLAL